MIDLSLSSLRFRVLPALLPALLLFHSPSAEEIRNDTRERTAPPTATVLNEIPIKPEIKSRRRMFFNTCEECMKDSRQWHYGIAEIKAVVDRCGADYLLVRFDRKFVDSESEIISRFNFSSRAGRMELDSIEMVQRWKNGDINAWSQTTAASGAVSIPLSTPTGLTPSAGKPLVPDVEAIAGKVAGFESKMTRSGTGRYRLHFRLDGGAWIATDNGIAEASWPWKRIPAQKPLAGFMVGYFGEGPEAEGSCFNKQENGIVVTNLLVDYPLNQCRISFEVASGTPLGKALFSTSRTIDSVSLGGAKNIRVSRILPVDTTSKRLFLEISDIYGKTAVKMVAVYDQLRKDNARRDTLRRVQRALDSLATRSTAFRVVHAVSLFDGNILTPLIRDYLDTSARTAVWESGTALFKPSAAESLLSLPFPGRIENLRDRKKYYLLSHIRIAPAAPAVQRPSYPGPYLFSKTLMGLLSVAIPVTDGNCVPAMRLQSPSTPPPEVEGNGAPCLLFSCLDATYRPDTLEILSLPGLAGFAIGMNFYVVFSSRTRVADSVTMTYIVKFTNNEETMLQKMMKPDNLLQDRSMAFSGGKMNSRALAFQCDSRHSELVERNEITALKDILKVDIYAFDNISRQTIGASSVWYVP